MAELIEILSSDEDEDDDDDKNKVNLNDSKPTSSKLFVNLSSSDLKEKILKFSEEAFKKNEEKINENTVKLIDLDYEFDYLNSRMDNLQFNTSEVKIGVDKYCRYVASEKEIDDKIEMTGDGFLRIYGRCQTVFPISSDSNRAIRIAKYSPKLREDDHIVTNSKSAINIYEDVIPERPKSPEMIAFNVGGQQKQLIPPIGPIIKPILKVNDQVFACTSGNDLSGEWKIARINDITLNENKKFYRIEFTDKSEPPLFLSSKCIAYTDPASVLISVGTFVVANYRKDPMMPNIEATLYSGMIAETPKPHNRYRYLIFFIFGKVSYVSVKNVHLIIADNIKNFDHIKTNRYKKFLKNYCEKYPERHMIRFQVGEQIGIKFNHGWQIGTVTAMDCSLAKFTFTDENHFEWLYRGSYRFESLYEQSNEISTADAGHKSSKPKRNKLIKSFQGRSHAFIQYYGNENEEDDEEKEFKKSIYVAKKSTAKAPNIISPTPSITVNLVDIPESLINSINKEYTHLSHRCDSMCISFQSENFENFHNVNPFAFPLIAGWKRNFEFQRRNRTIFYITPCGLKLSSIDEIQDYLEIVQSNLSVMFFTFSPISIYDNYDKHEMSVKCFYYNKDISNGKEFHPISVINLVDNQQGPPKFIYSERRLPTTGVIIPTDYEFLSCCNCKDNCKDPYKCSCQLLTRQGSPGNFGYTNMRLLEFVMTGVFECNSRCSCNQRCVNKVVQRGIMVQLQLIKTERKGWGVRVMHDVPKGTFICTYSAEVFNDQSIGDDDTYLADLDYIDICEGFKEDYEARAYESDDDENNYTNSDDSDYESRNSKRKRKEKYEKQPNKVKKAKPFSIRQYFQEDFSYTLDAKHAGNIGRFLNHSCNPNCYVQNVFVDTHDLRFPWAAIFCQKDLKAFEEVVWDYNYSIGSVEGKKLFCYCGAANCRKRLL